MQPITSLLASHVRKPTAIVHFRRDMSSLEQKLITIISYHVQLSESDNQGFYFIDLAVVKKLVGWDKTQSNFDVVTAFNGLYENSIEWNFLGADRTMEELKCRLIIALAKPSSKGGKIGFRIYPDIEKLIRNPKVFCKFKLIMMGTLNRPIHAFPLYELVVDSYCRGEKTIKVEIKALKEYLGLSADKYSVFKDFNKWVLKPSIDTINKKSDYNIEYITYRLGRKIGGVIFTISQQAWQIPMIDGLEEVLGSYHQDFVEKPCLIEHESKTSPLEDEFINSLVVYDVAPSLAKSAIEQHSLIGAIEIRDYVLADTERRKNGTNPVENVAAYMNTCFTKGFGKQTDETRQLKLQEQENKRRKVQQEKHDKVLAQLKREVERLRKSQLREKLVNIKPTEMQILEAEFAKEVANGWHSEAVRDAYQEKGLKNVGVKGCFNAFLAKKLLPKEEDDLTKFIKTKGLDPSSLSKAT